MTPSHKTLAAANWAPGVAATDTSEAKDDVSYGRNLGWGGPIGDYIRFFLGGGTY